MVGTNSIVGDYAREIIDCAVGGRFTVVAEATIDRAYRRSSEDGDSTDTIARAMAALEDLAAAHDLGGASTMGQAVNAAMVRSERAARGDVGAVGLDTGIPTLDAALCGLHAGSLTIIAARSGEGKSALAAQILRYVASVGIPSRVFSMEMTDEDIGTVNLASLSGVPADLIRRGRISNEQAEALLDAQMALSGMPIKIVSRPDITLSEAISETRVAVRRDKIRLVVFDHRDLFGRDPGHEQEPEIIWYRHVTRRLKAAAKTLGIAFVVLVQLSRDIERREDKRPRKSDLYGAGEQDADDIIMIYRPELHAGEQPKQGDRESSEMHANRLAQWHRDQEMNRGRAELYLVKRRFGPPAMVTLTFEGRSLSFR